MRSKPSGSLFPSLFVLLTIVCISMLSSFKVHSEIFKTTLPDGRIIFSDQAGDKAERIELEPTNQIPALRKAKTKAAAEQEDQEEEETRRYTLLTISSPADDTLIDGLSGKTDVIINMQPELAQGHTLTLYINGKAHSTGRNTLFKLTELPAGSYTLKATIKDRSGKTLKSSKTSRFHIRRTPPDQSRRRGGRR